MKGYIVSASSGEVVKSKMINDLAEREKSVSHSPFLSPWQLPETRVEWNDTVVVMLMGFVQAKGTNYRNEERDWTLLST